MKDKTVANDIRLVDADAEKLLLVRLGATVEMMLMSCGIFR
jgi:hypothetical protein